MFEQQQSANGGVPEPPRPVAVTVAGLDVSFRTMDGGGKRVAAFLHALANQGCVVNAVGVGPQGTAAEKVVSSRLHRIKRRLFPIPFRGRVEAELPVLDGRRTTISLIMSTHRWALRGSPNWLDFPDLWSNVARVHAQNVDGFCALFNMAQARLWSNREAAEYNEADVVSVASWSDCRQLGSKAVWLPNPITESRELVRRRQKPSSQGGRVYGMIANFNYPPNRHAYQRLVREWLPELLPSASRIVVAGFGSETLPRVMNVDVIGPVDSVAAFYDRIDVAVAPIELGGGMKVKVVEAMVHGVPVIATEHAVEGLPRVIAEECARLGNLSSELRDPRENPAVVNALGDFTFESFEKKFSSTWREKMVPGD